MELVNDINLEEIQELNTGELLEISAGCWSGGGGGIFIGEREPRPFFPWFW